MDRLVGELDALALGFLVNGLLPGSEFIYGAVGVVVQGVREVLVVQPLGPGDIVHLPRVVGVSPQLAGLIVLDAGIWFLVQSVKGS